MILLYYYQILSVWARRPAVARRPFALKLLEKRIVQHRLRRLALLAIDVRIVEVDVLEVVHVGNLCVLRVRQVMRRVDDAKGNKGVVRPV